MPGILCHIKRNVAYSTASATEFVEDIPQTTVYYLKTLQYHGQQKKETEFNQFPFNYVSSLMLIWNTTCT